MVADDDGTADHGEELATARRGRLGTAARLLGRSQAPHFRAGARDHDLREKRRTDLRLS